VCWCSLIYHITKVLTSLFFSCRFAFGVVHTQFLTRCDTKIQPLTNETRRKSIKSPDNTLSRPAEKAFSGKDSEEVWFGLEQEFTLFNLDERTPLGWPEFGMPSRPQGPYYCSVGPENNFGRAITDSMYKACLYAGIAISGVNGEVMPGQQEYQGMYFLLCSTTISKTGMC
jgi:glutamine synthetase